MTCAHLRDFSAAALAEELPLQILPPFWGFLFVADASLLLVGEAIRVVVIAMALCLMVPLLVH